MEQYYKEKISNGKSKAEITSEKLSSFTPEETHQPKPKLKHLAYDATNSASKAEISNSMATSPNQSNNASKKTTKVQSRQLSPLYSHPEEESKEETENESE